MSATITTNIVLTEEATWKYLLEELKKEEAYEKLALLQKARQGLLQGKTVKFNRQMSTNRTVHCLMSAYLKHFDVKVICSLTCHDTCEGKVKTEDA